MDLDRWALAFACLPWPERRKAELWRSAETGEVPPLAPVEARALEARARTAAAAEVQPRPRG